MIKFKKLITIQSIYKYMIDLSIVVVAYICAVYIFVAAVLVVAATSVTAVKWMILEVATFWQLVVSA